MEICWANLDSAHWILTLDALILTLFTLWRQETGSTGGNCEFYLLARRQRDRLAIQLKKEFMRRANSEFGNMGAEKAFIFIQSCISIRKHFPCGKKIIRNGVSFEKKNLHGAVIGFFGKEMKPGIIGDVADDQGITAQSPALGLERDIKRRKFLEIKKPFHPLVPEGDAFAHHLEPGIDGVHNRGVESHAGKTGEEASGGPAHVHMAHVSAENDPACIDRIGRNPQGTGKGVHCSQGDDPECEPFVKSQVEKMMNRAIPAGHDKGVIPLFKSLVYGFCRMIFGCEGHNFKRGFMFGKQFFDPAKEPGGTMNPIHTIYQNINLQLDRTR